MTNRRFTALVTLFSDHLKDAVRRVALFAGKLLILAQERFNTELVGTKHRSRLGARELVGLEGIESQSPTNGIAATSFFFGKLANAFVLQMKGAPHALAIGLAEHGPSSVYLHSQWKTESLPRRGENEQN